MGCRLVIRQDGQERSYELREPRIILGRTDECEIPVYDGKCSRQQAEIVRVDEGYKIVDLESRNGTRVNDKVINQHLLVHGDVIRIGQVTLTFEDTIRDPKRRIPGRLSDYGGDDPPPPAQVQPGALDLKPQAAPTPPPPTRPSLRKTTQRLSRAESVLRRPTEGISSRNLGAREEVRRKAEEQSILKTVVIIVGVFFGLVVFFMLINFLNFKSPETRSGNRNYTSAVDRFRQAQNESDPKLAIAHAKAALREINSIPPGAGPTFHKGQEMSGRIRDFIEEQTILSHREEVQKMDDIWTRAAKAKTSRQVEGLLAEIETFRESFPESLPETFKKLGQVEAELQAKRGTTQQSDFEEAKERVEAFLKRNQFTLALVEADKMLETFKGDFDLHQRAIAQRERVIESVRIFVEDRSRRAREYLDRGDPEMSRNTYDEILNKLGDVEAFRGYVELILRERE